MPNLTGKVSPRDIEQIMLELPARILNPKTDAAKLKDSERLCKLLVEKLLSSDTDFDGVACRQKRASEIQKQNERRDE